MRFDLKYFYKINILFFKEIIKKDQCRNCLIIIY